MQGIVQLQQVFLILEKIAEQPVLVLAVLPDFIPPNAALKPLPLFSFCHRHTSIVMFFCGTINRFWK